MGSRRSLGRRCDADRGRRLRVDAVEGRLPWQMSQPTRLLARLLAQRALGCTPDGCKAWSVVCRLLLGPDGVAVRTRADERRLDGNRRGADRIREADSVASYCDLRD